MGQDVAAPPALRRRLGAACVAELRAHGADNPRRAEGRGDGRGRWGNAPVVHDRIEVVAAPRGVDQGSVALRICTAARPLHTRFTNMFGASISEAKMRPNPSVDYHHAGPLSTLTAPDQFAARHPPTHLKEGRRSIVDCSAMLTPGEGRAVILGRRSRSPIGVLNSQGRHCHSTLSLTVIGFHPLVIYTVILLSSLPFPANFRTQLSPRAEGFPRQPRAGRGVMA